MEFFKRLKKRILLWIDMRAIRIRESNPKPIK